MNASADRIQELLAERAVTGLPRAEVEELGRLLRFAPEWDDDGFDRAAAALDLAFTGSPEPMPWAVRERVEHVLRTATPEGSKPVMPASEARRRSGASWSSRLGWLAAAAALFLAIVGWWPRLGAPGAETGPAPITVAGDAEEAHYAWQATEDPAAAGVAGEVVWRAGGAGSYMVFRGLEANDPAESQYQLWIFDAARDQRYPVDGGVFDIPADAGEARVAIDPKIAVEQPALFAVTVERPGGVVVSDRERILLVAEV